MSHQFPPNVIQLSTESGIPLWLFAFVTGDLPNVPSLNYTETKKLFQQSRVDSVETILLAHQLITGSQTLPEAAETARLVAHLSDKLGWLSFRQWNKAAMIVVEITEAKDDLLDLLQLVPNQSLSHNHLIQKLIKLPLSEDEAELVFCHLTAELGDYTELLSSWLGQTTKLVSIAKIFHYSLHGSEIRGEAWEKWNFVAREALTSASEDEIKALVQDIPSGGPAMEFAAIRLLKS